MSCYIETYFLYTELNLPHSMHLSLSMKLTPA